MTIDFRSSEDPCMWGVILGDNGVGKTTILRSMAMCLLGAGSTFGLLDELGGDWIRTDTDGGSIRLEIKPDGGIKGDYYVQLDFRRESDDTVWVDQETHPEPFPWDKLFFCGYGATRGVSGTESYREYKRVHAILTLFDETAQLQNTELPLRRIGGLGPTKQGSVLERVLNWIENILMIPKGSIKLTDEGLTVSGPWGPSMLAAALGDGHRATMSWVVDFLAWAMLYDKTMFEKELSGIVLIDEIEQHIHPQWQKRIVKLLRDQFPKVQFIATTHSPLCAIGTTDLNDKECTLALLTQAEENCVRIYDKLKPPRNQRADQVLTSYLFELATSGDNATVRNIERYSYLMNKKRTPEEEKEAQTLRDELDKSLGTEETELQRLVAQSIQKSIDEQLELSSIDPKVIDYEIKRQLRELFGHNK